MRLRFNRMNKMKCNYKIYRIMELLMRPMKKNFSRTSLLKTTKRLQFRNA